MIGAFSSHSSAVELNAADDGSDSVHSVLSVVKWFDTVKPGQLSYNHTNGVNR